MESPNFLHRVLGVTIQPAGVLWNSLIEMQKLNDWAILAVTGTRRFQILGLGDHHSRFQSACAILDMNSDSIVAPSNSDGYSLHFHVRTWIFSLRDSIWREPSSSLSIIKASGSPNLFCLFGNDQQPIRLGVADFISRRGIDLNYIRCYLRVTMTSEQFRELIQDFDTRHRLRISPILMKITRTNIRWITLIGAFDHSAADYNITGITEDRSFVFGLWWDSELFQRLCLVSNNWEFVELYVFESPAEIKLYGLRFFMGASQSYYYNFIPAWSNTRRMQDT